MSTRETVRQQLVTWSVPALAAAIGLGYLVAGLLGDDRGFAVGGLVTMLVAAAVFVALSRWSETVRHLRDRRDERINSLDRSASLFAGMTVLAAVLVMFVVEVAGGRDGAPYMQLGSLGGVAYVAALVWLRFRR